jgi:hypothetical protein
MPIWRPLRYHRLRASTVTSTILGRENADLCTALELPGDDGVATGILVVDHGSCRARLDHSAPTRLPSRSPAHGFHRCDGEAVDSSAAPRPRGGHGITCGAKQRQATWREAMREGGSAPIVARRGHGQYGVTVL